MPSLKGFFSSIEDRNYRLILIFFAVYTAILIVVPLARLVPRVPVPLFTFALCYFLYRWRKMPGLVRPWVFYILLSLAYWQLQFVVTSHFDEFHGATIIVLEKTIFGGLPVLWLQEMLYTGTLRWFDYVCAVVHASLFVMPILLPLSLLCFRGVERMKRATVALVLISLSGYATYVLYPLTPPWMASLENAIPPVHRISIRALERIAPMGIVSAFQPSPRGAMPSLHAGVPLLVMMIAFKEFGRKVWWLPLLVAGITFEITYGAEHYIVDIIAGFIYAVFAYLLVYRLLIPDRRLGPGRKTDAGRRVE